MLIADSLGYRVDSLSVIPTVITLLSETESKPNSQKTKAFHSWKTGVSLTRCQKSAALFDRNDPQKVPVLQMKRLCGEEG